ncbi:putative protein tyrosine kinase [Lyophyllum shimeji]|uniref:non-specific serine/threonine protein kinase n=1 Tax=Lyophyllum shimeji TaxID=47721 RepID=A0A9P3UKA0_LYOSH|nr:putative protein tyrosine kinase [Lyophyllum shimeji]
MAPTQPCAKYQYVVTANGPKILPVEESSCKDEESPADYNAGGYLPVKVGDTFKNGRYRVIRKLGWGHFSTVWLVKDLQESCHSALKVVKSAGRYAETARDEIKLLNRVASFSPTHPGRLHIVSFLDSFVNQGPESSHVCIVFEPLGENLLAMIERNKKKGVPRALVKVIAKQILLGLQYLHDECDLVHTDIKPENILIAIPDIEAHIEAELSQSPVPTSRRVGVPLPTKSRAGVSIPHSQQRARRQVQIFDSQPLSSPSRSIDITRSGPASMSVSVSARHGYSASGSNSVSGSYVAQMQLSRLTASGPTNASGMVKSLSSAASGLTASAPLPNIVSTSKSDHRVLPVKDILTHNPLSPSTSSSSSSISSTLASTAAGSSSIISTPPTSLSHSLGNVVAGFMGMAKLGDQDSAFPSGEKALNRSREGLPVRSGKGKPSLEDELEDAASTNWMGKPRSWADKISSSLSSSYKSSSSSHRKSKLCQVQTSHNSQPRSGVPSSSFWKDPGTAAPAPAVVVSVVAGADGGDETGNYFDFASTNHAGAPTISATSSATATTARPSRTGTPDEVPTQVKPSTSQEGVKSVAADAPGCPADAVTTSECSSHTTQTIARSNPSLLTQTAPHRIAPSSNAQGSASRSPPHHQTSHTAAHNHTPIIPCICSDPRDDHNVPRTTKSNPVPTKARCSPPPHLPIVGTSITPTLTSPPPSAPPPTPVDSPTVSALIPPPIPAPTRPHVPAIQVPIPIPAPVPPPPPIFIKIADLGNATPSTKHYTEDIQTRQYRAPEAILGKRDWDARADIWSVACVVFELLTAEFLFDPHGQGELFTKDDDHMAQIIELLGDFPLEIKMGGRYSRELFDHAGNLRYIHSLKPWPLKRVMMEKYLYTNGDAEALSEFLLPMLAVDMKQRKHAREMLDHPWLVVSPDDEPIGEW